MRRVMNDRWQLVWLWPLRWETGVDEDGWHVLQWSWRWRVGFAPAHSLRSTSPISPVPIFRWAYLFGPLWIRRFNVEHTLHPGYVPYAGERIPDG